MRNMLSRSFKLLLAVFAAGLFVSMPVQAQLKANNYQECILEATRQGLARDRVSVGRVKESCRERFPKSAPETFIKLNEEALNKMEIWTNRDSDGNINGTVYNGNAEYVVRQITLLLTPVKTGDAVQDFFDSEEFEIPLDLPPKKTGRFSIPADKTTIDGQFRWNLIKVLGY